MINLISKPARKAVSVFRFLNAKTRAFMLKALLLTGLLLPLSALADPPQTSPWNVGANLNQGSGSMLDKVAAILKAAFSYIGLFVGGIIIIGAAIYVWHSVNMPKEEKEHHNIPLRIMMGLAGMILGLALVSYLIIGMSS